MITSDYGRDVNSQIMHMVNTAPLSFVDNVDHIIIGQNMADLWHSSRF
jgi:hypothetical protein